MFVQSIFNDAVSGVDTGDIGHSLRLRSASSAYLSRAFGAPSNQDVCALSIFCKRGVLGSIQTILSAGTSSTALTAIRFNAADKLELYSTNASTIGLVETNAVFREPTAALHLFIIFDPTNGTAADRFRVWVNSIRITSFTTTTPISSTPGIHYLNRNIAHAIGRNQGAASQYLDGYLSRIAFVDNGGAIAPTDFGYLNTEINEWVSKSQSAVKAVVDAGGTNSFMLDFDDATSLTTLGYDKSTKGNNWTPNNFSLTAGTSYDWMLDVPGNSYATLNPLDTNSAVTAANGNLSYTSSNDRIIKASQAMTSGKWYWEYVPGAGGNQTGLGVVSPATNIYGSVNLSVATAAVAYLGNGNKAINGTQTAYGSTFTASDVLGVALDLDANTVVFYKNGVAQPSISVSSGLVWFPGFDQNVGTNYVNFGQAPLHASATYHSAAGGYFRYAPPSGFKALCQRNMPDPAILNPEKHFDVDTYTGTGSAINRTGFSLQPDFVWIKGRASTYTHALFDSVRGITKVLNSNTTDAEATEAGGAGLTALNSDGYSLGTNAADASTNVNTQTFAAWLWKAGGAAVTNNAGSISSQVSANVTAGFSIVTYTGTGANETVGHGLGKVPSLVIHFNRNVAYDHPVWHRALLGTEFVNLNTTAAKATDATLWNSAIPTSTVINLGTSARTNYNQQVAYCFAEIEGYSKTFSYTGNGNADGPVVECGFKPKYVLIKRVDAASDWQIWDGVRLPYNEVYADLKANLSNAEAGASFGDFISSGLKVRNTSYNVSGGTYIGIAFADVTAKYSLAR